MRPPSTPPSVSRSAGWLRGPWPFRRLCFVFYGAGVPLALLATTFAIDKWTMYPPDWLALFGPLLWFTTPALLPGLLAFNAVALLLGFLFYVFESRVARLVVALALGLVWWISGVSWVAILSVL